MQIRDGHRVLFDYDIKTGRQVWRYDPDADGNVTFETVYRVDDVLEANHTARSAAAGTKHGDWSRIASVPLNTFYAELEEAQSQMDGRYIDRWLAENPKFKTR
jgi:glucose dehydrogenase